MNSESLIPFFISVVLILALFVVFIVMYLVIQKQKEQAHIAEKKRLETDHQNKLLKTRVEEQEQTMDQISKEIHDHIGQLLSFAKMNMFVVRKHAEKAEQIETIENVKKLLDQLIVDVRNISHNLSGEFIKKRGLANLLEEEISYINISDGVRCSLHVEGQPVALHSEKELLVYRIAQEAMHNCTKHSKATTQDITLSYSPDEFAMNIADNGVGFDTQKIYELKGIGFLNMLQRAKLLNGTLDIQSRPGAGCKIILRVPHADEPLIEASSAA